MNLIQLLLPLYNNEGQAFSKYLFNSVKEELTQRFGGVTIYTRSPATGLWKEDDKKIVQDDVVLFEIMVPDIDPIYWRIYKESLQNSFHQNEIIIRALPLQLL